MTRRLVGIVALASLAGLIAYVGRHASEAELDASGVQTSESPSNGDETLVAPVMPEPIDAEPASSDLASSKAQREALRAANSSRAKASVSEAELDVTVVSQEAGTPLAGVRLSVSYGRQPTARAAETNALEGAIRRDPVTGADGHARFLLKEGRYYLHCTWGVHREAYRLLEPEVLASGERRELRVELPTASDLRFCGRVLAAESGAPIEGAEVVLSDLGSESASSDERVAGRYETWHGSADASGRFEVAAASWKSSTVSVSSPGRVPRTMAVDARHGEPAREVVLKLASSASLVARVLDGEQPVEGASIYLTSTGRNIGRGRSDASGLVRIDAIQAGVACEARVRRPLGELPFVGDSDALEVLDEFELAPGQMLERDWHLPPLCSVRGIARMAEGSPLPGLELRWGWNDHADEPFYVAGESARDSEVTTDERGEFVIERVRSGHWWIAPAPSDSRYEAAPIATPLTIAVGQTSAFVDLEVNCGLYVRGVVLAPDGSPMSGASVASGDAMGTSDANGAFRLGPLAPGTHELVARAPRFADSVPVVARAGDSDVALRLEVGGTLLVRVVDGAGTPCTRVSATLFSPVHNGPLWPDWDSDPDDVNAIVWRGLTPGVYTAVVDAGDRIGWTGGIRIERGAKIVRTVVESEDAAKLDVRVEGRSLERRVRVIRDGIVIAETPARVGTRRLVVPAGRCEVVVSDAGGEQRREVEVAAGEVVEAVFDAR